jgi:hypothetical protein
MLTKLLPGNGLVKSVTIRFASFVFLRDIKDSITFLNRTSLFHSYNGYRADQYESSDHSMTPTDRLCDVATPNTLARCAARLNFPNPTKQQMRQLYLVFLGWSQYHKKT